jgi:hypothetical protein
MDNVSSHGEALAGDCVDASSLVFLARLRIGEVWGTDQDLSLDGARTSPAVE